MHESSKGGPGTASETLARLARRAADPEYDPRHGILDVSGELRALEPDSRDWPSGARAEFADLLRELDAVQPRFPSHRKTSVLFDRAGMGQAGLERARRLIGRLAALSRAVDDA